jgi:ornithine cyclodeaminase/alanine dehydrogenase-like protein (mu-crystallin family)
MGCNPDKDLRGEGHSRRVSFTSTVTAELGDVLAGTHSGRTSADQTTIYGGVGLAFQDAVCAWFIYQEAMKKGIGQRVDFLG